jgi:hypothetical protein
MAERRTLVIGRGSFADAVIADASVAPHHAELVVTATGRLHLTDARTPGGTWRRSPSGAWERLRQAFVAAEDTIRLGEHVCTPGDLLRAAEDGEARPGRGRLVRDAVTGEVVRRRE